MNKVSCLSLSLRGSNSDRGNLEWKIESGLVRVGQRRAIGTATAKTEVQTQTGWNGDSRDDPPIARHPGRLLRFLLHRSRRRSKIVLLFRRKIHDQRSIVAVRDARIEAILDLELPKNFRRWLYFVRDPSRTGFEAELIALRYPVVWLHTIIATRNNLLRDASRLVDDEAVPRRNAPINVPTFARERE